MNKRSGAIFISGNGSNLQIFLNRQSEFEKLLVLSSDTNAHGVTRAKEAGVEYHILPKKIDWTELDEFLANKEIDFIFLAGFMRIVPGDFVRKWLGKIFNLHPSLLPRFKGLAAIEQAIEANADVGASIHHVTAEVDAGEVVLQELAVSKAELKGLSVEQVTDQVHKVEHSLVEQWIDQLQSKSF